VASETSSSTSWISAPSVVVASPLATFSSNEAAICVSSANEPMFQPPELVVVLSSDEFVLLPALVSLPVLFVLLESTTSSSFSAICTVSDRPPEPLELLELLEVLEVLEVLSACSLRRRRAPVCTETTLMRDGSICKRVAMLLMKLS
jgi:hypothetical protein